MRTEKEQWKKDSNREEVEIRGEEEWKKGTRRRR